MNVDEATIFSKSEQVVLKNPADTPKLAGMLKKFIYSIGSPLSKNGIIVGHIKMLAKVVNKNDNKDFLLFLSLTRLDSVDVRQQGADLSQASDLALDINVLVFGHDLDAITQIVETNLEKLRCGEF